MKTKSIQESVLEEIFGLEENCFPSFFYNQPPALHSRHQQFTNLQPNNHPQYHQSKPAPSSMNELEDQILKMRARAAKMTNKYKDTNSNANISKKSSKNIKTEHCSEDTTAPINYSMIYTKRSSLDESLYDKALREESARKSWINKKQKQLNYEELKECSYRPSINPTSKEIMSRLDKQQIYDKIKKKKEESTQKIIEETQLKQMKECSFTPKIGKGPKKMMKSVQVEHFTIQNKDPKDSSTQPSRHSISIFNHLYEDSKTRQLKNKKLEETYIQEYYKKPKLDDISRQITKNTNFEERRLKYEKRKIQKQMEIKEKENKSLRDSCRPSINSTSHHRSKQVPIGEYLYLQSKRDATPKHESKKPLAEKFIQPNKKSVQVYQERKSLVFYQLFKLLDKNEIGAISTHNLNLQLLPREVVKIIYPLIEELQVMEVELHQNEFIHSISNLFKSLNVHERDVLLGFVGGTKEQEDKDLFKPKLNNKSKMIASCNQRSQMSIYEYCSIKEIQKQKLLEEERVEKSKRELQNCTFHPKITHYRR